MPSTRAIGYDYSGPLTNVTDLSEGSVIAYDYSGAKAIATDSSEGAP